jgi:CheY-like chemotaxis protein
MRILIVDDEPNVADHLSHMLGTHEVTTVLNGADAFTIYSEQLSLGASFDFVLLGLELPGMDGIALRRAIWAKNPNQRLGWTTAYPVLQRPHSKDALLAFVGSN